MTAGTWSGTLDNRDGLFDPGNTASAIGGRVLPYQPFRIRAQWPVTTNLLLPEQATCGGESQVAAGTEGTKFGVSGDYEIPMVATSATAWQGSRVWQVSPYSVNPGSSLMTYGPVPIPADMAGKAFAFSVRIRCVTAGVNPTVTPFLRWLDILGNTISTAAVAPIALTGAVSAAWTFAGVPGMAPPGAASTMLTAAPDGQWDFQADGAQFEQNSFATAFGVPGSSNRASLACDFADSLHRCPNGPRLTSAPVPPGRTLPASGRPTARSPAAAARPPRH